MTNYTTMLLDEPDYNFCVCPACQSTDGFTLRSVESGEEFELLGLDERGQPVLGELLSISQDEVQPWTCEAGHYYSCSDCGHEFCSFADAAELADEAVMLV